MSQNPHIGILPPGPIDNTSLFASAGLLRVGLQKSKDYKCVNPAVWTEFNRLYNGKNQAKAILKLDNGQLQVEDEEIKVMMKRSIT